MRSRLFAITLTAALAAAACGGDGDSDLALDADAVTTTTEDATTTTEDEAPTTTSEPTTTTTEADPEPVGDDPADGDIPGGSFMVGAKTVLLDGFIGVDIPEGWQISGASVPLLSETEGTETELDEDALQPVLELTPLADPEAAGFTLVHYMHSDKVPDLGLFSTAIRDYAAQDGSEVSEPREATIGGQSAMLHTITLTNGTTGLLIPLVSGPEYFFIISLVPDKSYSDDAAAIVTSLSFVPEVLHS